MPGINYGGNLLGANFSAQASDMASAGAGGNIAGGFSAEIARGINIDAHIGAFANLDASFRKFISLELLGEAHAKVQATGQIQAPTNLFDEAGVAVRLAVAAEAAAGVQLGLGLKIGDFISLVESQPDMQGLPARLFRLFMEEVSIGGGVYAKAAVSAMAYANLVITGRVVPTVKHGADLQPGFDIVAEAGAGLKAGAGFRVFANIGFQDARRFVRRSTDVLVDELIDQILKKLPQDDPSRPTLDTFRAPAKIAFRNAYEIGELITERSSRGSLTFSRKDAEQVALRCTNVILEEAQRFILQKAAEAALKLFEDMLSRAGITRTEWESDIRSARQAFANRLSAMPAEPFEPTTENRDYWINLVNDAAGLGSGIATAMNREGINQDEWTRPVSVVWSALQLLFASMETISSTTATVDFLNIDPVNVQKSFPGSPVAQPPTSEIRAYINQIVGNSSNANVDNADLVKFLISDVVLDPLRAQVPSIDEFFKIFESAISSLPGSREVIEVLLSNSGGFVPSGDKVDPVETLKLLRRALRDFLQTQVRETLVPVVHDQVEDDPNLKRYFDEVCVPTLSFTIDTVFVQVERWTTGELTAERLQEALSSVLLVLAGRSVVVTTDVMVAEVQSEIKSMFNRAADDVGAAGGLASALSPAFGGSREDLEELLQDTLRIGGDVFGPLPNPTRGRIRELLYDAIEPLPLDHQGDFLEELGDQFFVPNQDRLLALGEEMAAIAAGNFIEFAERVLLRIAEMILEELAELIRAIAAEIEVWVGRLEEALEDLRKEIARLVREIGELIEEVEARFDEAADEFQLLLGRFASSTTRGRLLTDMADAFYSSAVAPLRANGVYKLLPGSVKRSARSTLKSTVRSVIASGILDDVLDAAGNLAYDLNDLIEDIRNLDPDEGVASGVGNLILNRLEDAIADAFGGSRPSISLKFTVSFRQSTLLGPVRIEETVNLGKVRIPLDDFLGLIRDALESMAFIENAISGLADKLVAAFAAELELKDREAEQEANEKTKEAMESQTADNRPGNREITILSPSPASVYTGDIEVHIQLDGVPNSFLGLGENEMARVHVWLNQDPQALDTFTARNTASIETESTSSATHFTPGAHVEPWGTTRGVSDIERSRSDQSAMNVADRFGGVPRRDVSVKSGHSHASDTMTRRGRSQKQDPSPDGLDPKSMPPSGIGRSAAGIVGGPGLVSKRGLGAGRGFNVRKPPTTRESNANMRTLGRRLTTSQINWMKRALPPSLLLQKKLPITDLEAGINTLTVAIIEGEDRTLEQVVTFIVTESIEAPTRPSETTLPTRSGKKDPNGKPKVIKGKGFVKPKAERKKSIAAGKAGVKKQVKDPRQLLARKPKPKGWSAKAPWGAVPIKKGTVLRARVIKVREQECLLAVGPDVVGTCPAKYLKSKQADWAISKLAVGDSLTVEVVFVGKDGSMTVRPTTIPDPEPRPPRGTKKRKPGKSLTLKQLVQLRKKEAAASGGKSGSAPKVPPKKRSKTSKRRPEKRER